MDIDAFTDAFFSDPPPLQAQEKDDFTTLDALAIVISHPALEQAAAELHIQLREQYCQGDATIEESIGMLRDRHEQELAELLETAGRSVAVVHSDTMESVVLRQKQEIDDALIERHRLRAALVTELQGEFSRFLRVSSCGTCGGDEYPKCMTSLIGYGVAVPCSTVKIPNPLRGVLVGARPKDPALSAVVLDVSPSSCLSAVMDLAGDPARHKEHLRRLGTHRHSVMMITDEKVMLPAPSPELILQGQGVQLGGEILGTQLCEGMVITCGTAFWGANITLRAPSTARGAVGVDGFRNVIGLAVTASADMLSFVLGRDHLEQELLCLIEAIAAAQIDIGAGRLTNAWSVSLAAISSGHSDTIQNQPVYSAHKQAFNLPITIRVFIPISEDMSEIRRFFHKIMEGRGLEWSGE